MTDRMSDSASPTNPLKLRRRWNLPRKFLGDGFQDLAYPIWNHAESGILATPTLVSAGPAYAADVFCKPSVARGALAVDVAVDERLRLSAVQITTPRLRSRPAAGLAALGRGPVGT